MLLFNMLSRKIYLFNLFYNKCNLSCITVNCTVKVNKLPGFAFPIIA